MKLLKCTQCGSTLEWDGATPVVVCSRCGARFQMNVSGISAGGNDWRQAALRGGCVADRPSLKQDSSYGKVYYRSWLPEGWTYDVGLAPIERASSVVTPFVPTITMVSADGLARIRHTSTNAFQDAGVSPAAQAPGVLFGAFFGGMNPTPPNGQMGLDGLVHYPTCTLDPRTNMRSRPLVSAAEYCDEIALLEDLGDLEYVQEQDKGSWCRRIYSCDVGGTPFIVMAEAQISVGEPVGFMRPRMWQVDYEMTLVCPEDHFQATYGEFNKVCETIGPGRDFEEAQEGLRSILMALAQNTQGAVNNAVVQMQADRNASWDRRRAIIQDEHAHAMNTMHQMNANTAATSDRVARWQSEAIRDVNTFASAMGPVEASTRWDHVYQGTLGSTFGQDTFLGVEGDWLDLGVDFTELPRI